MRSYQQPAAGRGVHLRQHHVGFGSPLESAGIDLGGSSLSVAKEQRNPSAPGCEGYLSLRPVTVGSGRVGFLFYSVTRVNSAPQA